MAVGVANGAANGAASGVANGAANGVDSGPASGAIEDPRGAIDDPRVGRGVGKDEEIDARGVGKGAARGAASGAASCDAWNKSFAVLNICLASLLKQGYFYLKTMVLLATYTIVSTSEHLDRISFKTKAFTSDFLDCEALSMYSQIMFLEKHNYCPMQSEHQTFDIDNTQQSLHLKLSPKYCKYLRE